jgi:hypothetical protein
MDLKANYFKERGINGGNNNKNGFCLWKDFEATEMWSC